MMSISLSLFSHPWQKPINKALPSVHLLQPADDLFGSRPRFRHAQHNGAACLVSAERHLGKRDIDREAAGRFHILSLSQQRMPELTRGSRLACSPSASRGPRNARRGFGHKCLQLLEQELPPFLKPGSSRKHSGSLSLDHAHSQR